MIQLPSDQHITYQLQYRRCGKPSCVTCRNGQGHGPYWYAYWREGSRLRSGYVGKVHPNDEAKALVVAQLSEEKLLSDTPLEVPGTSIPHVREGERRSRVEAKSRTGATVEEPAGVLM